MVAPPHCLRIPQRTKDELRFLFLAKHALSDGTPHPVDGTHATYHRELLDTLRLIGLDVTAADSYAALFDAPRFDFLITLLNRGGFRGSEMLAPLLAEYHRLPYLGGAPVVRGLSDDKHFMKRLARELGIRTPDWKRYPLGGRDHAAPAFACDALIIKPNASSASWGIVVTESWTEAWRHVCTLHEQGHDVIVERYVGGIDLAVPVIGAGAPWYLPLIQYEGGAGAVRSYDEKRDLVPAQTAHRLVTDEALNACVAAMCRVIVGELWPFDHGRLEFRLDTRSGELYFIEINLNCNLWSRKTIATVARQTGIGHVELVETILAHSLQRQGLLGAAEELAA